MEIIKLRGIWQWINLVKVRCPGNISSSKSYASELYSHRYEYDLEFDI